MNSPQTSAAGGDKRLYKSTFRFGNVITGKGHVLHFKGGMFATDNPDYIEFLDKEIAVNGFAGAVYIDPNAKTITAEQENPMLALRRKFFQEFEAERAAKLDPANDMGSTEPTKLTPASTTTIAPTAAGGDATQGARLAALSAQAIAQQNPGKGRP